MIHYQNSTRKTGVWGIQSRRQINVRATLPESPCCFKDVPLALQNTAVACSHGVIRRHYRALHTGWIEAVPRSKSH